MKMVRTFVISVMLIGFVLATHFSSTNAYTSGDGVHLMEKLAMKLITFISVNVGEDLCLM